MEYYKHQIFRQMKNLFKALASFQQEVPIIHKGTEGYGYSYADLPAILPIINPLLAKHGLGFTQLGTGTGIKTIIFHSESGETLESLFDIPQGVSLAKMNDFQVLGSAITYMRRYALSSALGLVTDKDTDAGGEQGKKQAQTDDKPWFNPTAKDGSINNAGTNWIEYAKKVGRAEAIKATESKYKISKTVREFLNTVNL
jgi:hypothetical protein